MLDEVVLMKLRIAVAFPGDCKFRKAIKKESMQSILSSVNLFQSTSNELYGCLLYKTVMTQFSLYKMYQKIDWINSRLLHSEN